MWTAMPCLVVSVDLVKMTCVAQPAIKGVQTSEDGSETFVNLPQLLDVPICYPSAGGFTLTLPMATGDEILAIIANRCIDSWWELGGAGPAKLEPQVPSEFRMHDLSDGFAIPGPRSLPRAALVPGISSVNAQLRNDAGTTYLEITPTGHVNIVAPAGLGVTGNLTVTGTITSTGDVVGAGKSLSTHIHGGVTTGSGNTGVPV